MSNKVWSLNLLQSHFRFFFYILSLSAVFGSFEHFTSTTLSMKQSFSVWNTLTNIFPWIKCTSRKVFPDMTYQPIHVNVCVCAGLIQFISGKNGFESHVTDTWKPLLQIQCWGTSLKTVLYIETCMFGVSLNNVRAYFRVQWLNVLWEILNILLTLKILQYKNNIITHGI